MSTGQVPRAGTSRQPGAYPNTSGAGSALAAEVDRLLSSAFAPSTHVAYRRAIATFEQFREDTGLTLCWPAPTDDIVNFVARLSLAGKSISTVRTYLAGIAAKHKLNSWQDPTDCFLVSKLLLGFSRCSTCPSQDSRFPITFDRLKLIAHQLPRVCSNSYEAKLFLSIYTLSFFGFFRISELVGQDKHLQGGRPGLNCEQVKAHHSRLIIHLPRSKTCQSGQGHQIIVEAVHDSMGVCPVLALSRFMLVRPNKPGPLFIHFNGSPLTRYQFQAVLKKVASQLGWETSGFSTHSFRIGACTTAAINRVPLSKIMEKGRWRSGAIMKYIRPDKV